MHMNQRALSFGLVQPMGVSSKVWAVYPYTPFFFTFTDLTVKWRLDRSMNEKRSSLVQHFSFGLCSLQKLLDRREKQQEIE